MFEGLIPLIQSVNVHNNVLQHAAQVRSAVYLYCPRRIYVMFGSCCQHPFVTIQGSAEVRSKDKQES